MKKRFFLSFFLCIVFCTFIFSMKAQDPNLQPLPDAEIYIKTSAPIGSDYMIEMVTDGDVEVNWGIGSNYEKVTASTLLENGGLYGPLKGPYISIKSTEGIKEIYLTFRKVEELSFKKAPNLYLLSATNNQLKTVEGLQNLPLLEDLNLSRNQIAELPPILHLKQLRINNNLISSSDIFNKMVGLEYLDCSNNAMASLELSNLTHLKNLIAKEMGLKSVHLSNCTLLETIVLSKNQLNSLNIKELGQLKKLEIGDNQLKKIVLPSSDKLHLLDLTPNLLSACMLDSIYTILPVLPEDPRGKNILVKNNPGAKTSKTEILKGKKWVPDVIGDGTGCIMDASEIGSNKNFIYADGIFSFDKGASSMSVYSMDAQKIFSVNFKETVTRYEYQLPQGQYLVVLYEKNGTKEILKITIP